MKTNKLTYLDILNDTIEYYSVDPVNRRSIDIDNDKCYYSFEGKNCAFGRYIDNVDKFIQDHYDYNHETSYSILNTFGMEVLKEEVRHLDDCEFWCLLQNLHDHTFNWNEKGLTEIGLSKVKKIKEYINQIK